MRIQKEDMNMKKVVIQQVANKKRLLTLVLLLTIITSVVPIQAHAVSVSFRERLKALSFFSTSPLVLALNRLKSALPSGGMPRLIFAVHLFPLS